MTQDTHLTDIVLELVLYQILKALYSLYSLTKFRGDGSVITYQHIGQHSSSDYVHCIKQSKLATAVEYANLKEMENLGYNINIVKKQNYKKYLSDYNKAR
jgi:hypothetical protein